MEITHTSPTSRPLAAAEALGDLAPDARRIFDKQVMLTGEAEILDCANGRECFLSALRLLVRICSSVTVALPASCQSLLAESQKLAQDISFGVAVAFRSIDGNFQGYDAILSVGHIARGDLPWTTINSQGWLARVSSVGEELAKSCDNSNPVGALAAASLGVSEVFKRLIHLKESRGPLFSATTFSLWTYVTGGHDPGPPLPARIGIDLALFGAGAIGNGIIHLLRQLPLTGRIDIIDRQSFGPENLGTCFLIGPLDVEKKRFKAHFAEEILNPAVAAKGYPETVSAYINRLGKLPYPRIILNALDNIDARHEAQSIWPDIAIDGAIGPFECQVSSHPWGQDVACLRCLFRHPPQSADTMAARATGLSHQRIGEAESAVTEEDVASSPPELRQFLQERIGRPICSVVGEAMAKRISNDSLPENFQPSVPFVATMSAAMVIAELARFISKSDPVLEPRFQFDLLHGPTFGQKLDQRRRHDCVCVTRAANIEKFRQSR